MANVNVDTVLMAMIAVANNFAALSAVYTKMRAEGRTDLSTEELDQIRNAAWAANDSLGQAISGGETDNG
jgi:hypothetical protein